MNKFISLWTAVLLFTACSYQDGHTIELIHSDNITIEEAQLYYNKHYADPYTRSDIDERLPFVIGDAEWLWEKAQTSSYNNKSAVDIPITGGYKYRAYRKQSDGTYHGVDTSSKIVVAQDDATGNISFYIRVSIPDTEEQNTSIESLNYEDRTNFSGLEYYITINGCPAAIVKFEDGNEIDGVFLGDTRIDKVSKLCKFIDLFGNLYIGKESIVSRANGDDNIGKIVGRFYDSSSGIWYNCIDIDRDGNADAIAIDSVDIVAYKYVSPLLNSGTNADNGLVTGGGSMGGTGGGYNQGATTSNNSNSTGDLFDNTFELVNPIKGDFISNTTIEGVIDLPVEPLIPSEIKSLILERLSTVHPISEFINSATIPIYPSYVIPNENIERLSADLKGQTIYYNTSYYNSLSNAGRLLAIFHEYMHLYLNSRDHYLMLNNLAYQQGLRDLFPDMSAYFYEKIQYVGCSGVLKSALGYNSDDKKGYDTIKKENDNFLYK